MQDLQKFDELMRAYFYTLPADIQNTVLYSDLVLTDLDGLETFAENMMKLYEQ